MGPQSHRPGALTVVVPTHRDRGFLSAALASVLPQLVSGDEILLVANGCTTAYLNSLYGREAPPIRVLHSAAGVAAARNSGVLSACGEYVHFLDDDDVLFPSALEKLRGILDRDVSAVGACGGVALWSAHEAEGVDVLVMPPASLTHNVLLAGPPVVSMGAAMFRRDALIAVGLLDQGLAPADDWDLWLKVAGIGTIVCAPFVALRYRFHDENESRKAASMAFATLRVFKIHYAQSLKRDRKHVLEPIQKLVDWHVDGLLRSLRGHFRAGKWRELLTDAGALMSVRLFALRIGARRSSAHFGKNEPPEIGTRP